SAYPPPEGHEGDRWSDSDGDFVYQNKSWYKDEGKLMNFIQGYMSSVGGAAEGYDDYDGSTMIPSSAYDYTYDIIPYKTEQDRKYIKNGSEGTMLGRAMEILWRDITAEKNTDTTLEAVVIVVGRGKAPASRSGRFTEPTIPDRTIAKKNGVTIEH